MNALSLKQGIRESEIYLIYSIYNYAIKEI